MGSDGSCRILPSSTQFVIALDMQGSVTRQSMTTLTLNHNLDMQGSVTRQSMTTLTLNHNIESQRGTLNMDLGRSSTWPRTT